MPFRSGLKITLFRYFATKTIKFLLKKCVKYYVEPEEIAFKPHPTDFSQNNFKNEASPDGKIILSES
jgi:hypothetical protein